MTIYKTVRRNEIDEKPTHTDFYPGVGIYQWNPINHRKHSQRFPTDKHQWGGIIQPDLDIDADRHVSPHSYGEGVKASFLVTIWNTGQNESNTCNVTCSIIRLGTIGFFNFDRDPEEMQQIEWTENSMDPRTGHSKTITFGCPIQNGLFAIYKIHARIDTKDSNSEDNSDSFIFFVVWVGWVDRWIDIID